MMGLRKARIYFVELLLDNRDVKLNFFSFLGYNKRTKAAFLKSKSRKD